MLYNQLALRAILKKTPEPFYMSDFKSTMACLLRTNPTIYPEPLDALLFLMLARGEWVGGQWTIPGVKIDDRPMEFSDLDSLDIDDASWRLSRAISRRQRQTMDENMETILEANPTAVYFRPSFLKYFRDRELVDGKVPEKAPFLEFPDDIQPDWGHAIKHFQDWLLVEMNQKHMLSPNKDMEQARAHWPAAPLALSRQIQQARERLHPLLHGGQSYAEHCRQSEALSRRLIEEMLAEEKATASPAPRRRRP